MSVRRPLLLAVALGLVPVAAGACGGSSTGSEPRTSTDGTLGGVGQLPAGSPAAVPPTNAPPLPTTTLPPEQQVGARVTDNRVLVIGDSVMASTARRYTGYMCSALVPLGWRVEVEAETNRFIEFGREVLTARLAAGWDVVVIMLGNNFNGNADFFRAELTRLVDRLAAQQVVLFTVTEFTSTRVVVNTIIRDVAAGRPNVTVVDWATPTALDPGLLGPDGLHLVDRGRRELAASVAGTLGAAPPSSSAIGSCLTSVFVDDSGGPIDGTTTTSVPRRPTTTVTTVVGPTTTKPGSTTTSSVTTTTTTTTTITVPVTLPTGTDPP
jgi:hypothetical protein